MKTKPILAILASATTGFFLGWIIFGLLLEGYYQSNMSHYEGLMKDPPEMWGFVAGNLLQASLFTYVFHSLAKTGSFLKGFIAASVITLFVMATFDVYFYCSMNLYTAQVLVVDVLANGLLGGIMGGVAAFILGTGRKA